MKELNSYGEVMQVRFSAWIVVALLMTGSDVTLAGWAGPDVEPVDLRCEYRENPLGIDVVKPRLSWRISDSRFRISALGPGKSSIGTLPPEIPRGVRQTAYRVLVASNEELLKEGKADLWDSGRVESDQSIHVEYAGKPLESRMECFWKVKSWTTEGACWSKPGKWTMGLLKQEDWAAKWIGLDMRDAGADAKDREKKRLAARYLRREFTAEKSIRKATVYICGLGFFDLQINGKKVGDHVMDPVFTEYNKRACYVTFDVSRAIRKGKNGIGVILGNGRFFAPRIKNPAEFKDYGAPRLLLQIEVEYADGSTAKWMSDGQWRAAANGPTGANSEYDGEEYDARKEMPGWDLAGFDDSSWQKVALLEAPRGKLVSQMMEPNRVLEILKPVSLTKTKPGSWIVDFGQAFYGQPRIHVKGPAGATIKLTEAYSLKSDGTLKTEDNRNALCTDIYVLKGQGEEIWCPRFRGQGFRRLEVSGWPGEPAAGDFEGLVVGTDNKKVGTFECSNPLINRIHRNIFWGARMYKRQGVPLDPDRDERQGWLGDPAKDAESDAFNFQVAAFYSKWLADIRLDQRPDGSIGDISPNFWDWGSNVLWPSVVTIIPEWLYDFYGDHRALEDNYGAIRRWMLFHRGRLEPDFTVSQDSYGDWCDASTMDQGGKAMGNTAMPLLSTAYYYNNCRITARLAKLLGKRDDEQLFVQLGEKVKEGFNRKFFDPASGRYSGDTQCGYVLALKFGLVPAEKRESVIARLADNVLVKNKGHLTVGLIGMQWLMQTLTEIGRPDVGYTIATQTSRPSWGYMISKDATTMWERWDCDTQGSGMNSEALLILSGNLDAWFYQTLAGIDYDSEHPGFKHIIMKPHPVGDLKSADASFISMYGSIRSRWKLEGGQFSWKVNVPPNTTATVYVPALRQGSAQATDASGVRESGKPAERSKGVSFLRLENGAAVYEVGSGCYEFSSPIGK